jgi:hypothetical protein
MMLAPALALLLATASPDPLASARDAFAAADYVVAERLALEAAAGGGEAKAAATYLAGLARFRTGRFEAALEALDAAEAGADSPAAWQFNRGACLEALGRPSEAEAAFLAAAADPAFRPLALIEAGWAALAAGAPARARGHAALARAAATEREASLLSALEEELSAGAAPAPLEPAEKPGPPGDRNDGAEAPEGWAFGGRLEAGWDADASHTESTWLERPSTRAVTTPSAFGRASLWATGRTRLGGGVLEGSYGLGQLAYASAAARDLSLQEHDATLAWRGSPRDGLWLEAALSGQLALAGLDGLRAMQLGGGARLSGRFETGEQTATLAEVAWTAKRGLADEFAALGGNRFDLAVAEEGRWANLTVRAGYRLQLERIGRLLSPLTALELARLCPIGPGGATACTAGVEVLPLSYLSQGGFGAARLALTGWLDLSLDGSLLRRGYLHDDFVALTRSDGGPEVARPRRRHDWRWATGGGLSAALGPRLALSLRLDWLGSAYGATATGAAGGSGGMGGLGGMAGSAAPAGASWDKAVVTLGLGGGW